MSRRFAAVVAHPDDDTFGVAGTVALHADDPGFHFTLIHATSGEAGPISDPALATRETLGRVREEEDRRSWVTLGREPDRHEWLRYPEHPDVVSTFGPDGITGHPDHITVGRATSQAFHRLRRQGVAGFRRLIHVAIPSSLIDAWNERLVASGREPLDPTQLYQPRGIPDSTVGLAVDTSAVASLVMQALREHRTQAGDIQEQMSEEEQIQALSREHGVIDWPPPVPGAPVLRDVFEGLD